MATNWPVMSLRQAGVTLIDCEHRTPPAEVEGYPYIAIPQLNDGHLDLSDVRRISPDNYALWTRRAKPKPYDVVLSRRCNPGETAYIPPGLECAIGQNLVPLRADGTRILPKFLRWLVRSSDWWEQVSRFLNVGAVFDSLKCADIPNFSLPVPPLPEQRAIASILGALDDKIELNRRMNRTLEAMARALFQSWFVDFDPVRAKAEGRETGLPAEIAALFPDGFVESELGEIPEGWSRSSLTNVIEVNSPRSIRKGVVAPYLDMANMPTQGHSPDDVVLRSVGSGARFMNGDTLLARITPCLENGKTAYVDFLEEGQVGWGSTEYIVLRPMPPLPTQFAYCLARDERFRDFAIHNMTGSSGRQRVPASALANYSIAVPTPAIAKQFGETVGPLFSKASASAKECRALASLRDTLLPKLISGQLRVPEAEALIEEAIA